MEAARARNQIFREGSGIVGRIEFPLSHCDISGLAHERRKFSIGHGVLVDPKSTGGCLSNRCLLGIEAIRAHAKDAFLDPHHPLSPRYDRTFLSVTIHCRGCPPIFRVIHAFLFRRFEAALTWEPPLLAVSTAA